MRKTSKLVTIGGPVGLAVGLTLGTLAGNGTAPWLLKALPFIEPAGELWMNALRVTVIPLIACLLVVGVCNVPKGGALGAWGSRTIGWFVAMLLFGGAFAIVAVKTYFLVSTPSPIALTKGSTEEAAAIPSSWVEQFMPTNAFAAAASGDVLAIAVLAALFGLALRSLPDVTRKPVESVFVGFRDAILVFVHWIVLAIPVGAFALNFVIAIDTGAAAVAVLAQFVAFVTVELLVLTVLLIFAIILVTRVRTKQVVSAIAPLVSVAAGTRSSLASLPVLVETSRQLDLPDQAGDIVLPTAVSLFKFNRTVTSTTKLLFMAALAGVIVSPQALVVFVGTVVLLSFATPGIPSGQGSMTIGAYVAAGVPIEAVMLFEVTEGITDIMKTVVNVVADFAVAVFVSASFSRSRTAPLPTSPAALEEPAG